LVGGFLGAGKTTLLLEAARLLEERGYRCGMITNDQGEALVDTALAQQNGIAVAEVAGGCFCCRFPDLLAAIRRLQATVAPDVILAEPVGSCTDLAATVLRPLQTQYPGQFEIAPLTILIDPERDLARFPDTVDYLYHRQLAEADTIALSKADLLDSPTVAQHTDALASSYPRASVMSVSGRTGEGLSTWLDHCMAESSAITQVLDLDYATYAAAEACLGCLNASGVISAPGAFSARDWLASALERLHQVFVAQGAAVAHVKLQVIAPTGSVKASLTQLGGDISWDGLAAERRTPSARFTLNARVTSDPGTLEDAVGQSVAEVNSRLGIYSEWTHFECFSPLPPTPTFRLTTA
jgi:Ni2+-binding GTPase involved in maturation of urease and hydrogenase